MIEENTLPFTTEYAGAAAYIASPSNPQWLNGVEPEYTLPAAWWNYFNNLFTKTNVQAASDIDSILTEMNTVLTAAGITPDPLLTNQLMAALTVFLNLKANLASPTFTGAPAAPTAVVGTNTTQLATTAFVAASGVPFGAIIPFAGATPPANWLLCNGAAVSRTTYASLFAVISTVYGAGDGSNTFNVPDMREAVPVCVGTSTRDSEDLETHDAYTLGQFKDDRVQDHRHPYQITTTVGDTVNVATGEGNWVMRYMPSVPNTGTCFSIRSGSTTRVKSIGLNYIIKALQ